jgi:hypothetical protein
MLKNVFATVFFLFMSVIVLQAQTADYKTYSIQVAAFSKVLEDAEFDATLKKFSNLKELGYIYETSYLSPSNVVPSKFFLGSYLGMHTAKKILAKVKRKGYKDAFIVEELGAHDPNETKHFNVLQLGAYKRLVMSNFKKLSDEVGQGYVCVLLANDGTYKVVLNAFDNGDLTDELIDAKSNKFGVWKRDVRDIYKVKAKKTTAKKATVAKKPAVKKETATATKPVNSKPGNKN